MTGWIKKNILYIAFSITLISFLGSLYFSEVMKLVPCVLCWYQRILMYPLVSILAVGILMRDKKVYFYVLPLSMLGFFVALYQNFLYYKILPENIVPCQTGISCTIRQVEWFGFITIPLMSMVAFAIINICMFIYIKSKNDSGN